MAAGPARAQGIAPSVPSAAPAAADSVSAPAVIPVVGAISVRGNSVVDSVRIVRTFEVSPGARFSQEAVQRGIRKLFALGLFDDAWVERIESGSRVDLVVHVVERPRIASIRFEGNRRRGSDDLEKKLFLKAGEAYSPVLVQTQIDTLVRYYKDQGFPRAAIAARTDSTAGPGKLGLTFQVSEGERVRITKVEFRGTKAFSAEKLRHHVATKKRGFFGGGELKEETFSEDEEKLVGWYRNHGYRDARMVGHELLPGTKPRDLTLVFTFEEGKLYRVGTVRWTGQKVVSEATLVKLWTANPGEPYDLSQIQRAQSLAYGEYAELGYLYLGIEPREDVRGDTVDVAFTISEGSPSHVRMVQITGNHGTRENVIRREIHVHEGDRFRRSLLVRSQGDIMRLGFFEDVQLDFVPAETTDVDITLKVKEKQVGTASAGAGYTAESGFTGFVELGHNNVLGNGQSLSLHLERGAKRSDYQLAFTEPWFRGTPTLLGFSAFNTDRQRDLYNEKRTGGLGRIGRPLPWPDYSRGSVSYSLENVTIHRPAIAFTAQDSIVLRGLSNGAPVLTSTVHASFLRNSTDNPFYPTHGSRFSFDTELAGGPWGGAINFHKYRVEMKAYLPSLLKRVTTMVRGRVGFLGAYADQHASVPDYERFRLGGGTTEDPLRGYDDYMVVPREFVRDVPVAYRSDTTITGTDTSFTSVPTLFSKVRYPGGRFMTLFTVEQQFPIAHPMHGVIFFDAGNTWDVLARVRPFDLRMGAGVGIRLEIPLLGNIGFDYGYGFDRRELGDRPKFVGHFLIGQTSN